MSINQMCKFLALYKNTGDKLKSMILILETHTLC